MTSGEHGGAAGSSAIFFADNDLTWLDFETVGLDLPASGTYAYVDNPSTFGSVLAYAIGSGPARTWHADGEILDWHNAPKDLRDAIDRGAICAAANAGFDRAVWNFATIGFPYLGAERFIDPLIQAGISNLPTSLEGASCALGGDGKQDDGKDLIKLFSVERASPREHPEEWQRFLAYARRDVDVLREVYRKTRPLPLNEWQQYWAFERVNQRGVGLDLPFVHRAAALAAEDAIAIGRRLREITNGVVASVNQHQRIAAWLHDHLDDAAMREILICHPDDDEDDNEDDEDADNDA